MLRRGRRRLLRPTAWIRLSGPSLAAIIGICLLQAGCGKSGGDPSGAAGAKATIQNKGSDTMVNLAQAWAEEYRKVAPTVNVEVSGGGSGQGVAALIKGMIDIANCSRDMKPEEIEQAKKNTGKVPREIIVGYDGLAVYVHKDNPLDEITFEQLAGIFAEGGRITRWSDLGVRIPNNPGDEIVRVSRQSNSGTYEFFREHVLNKRDFKLGSRDMNGSKEVVELVSSTPLAIGYSGMGYASSGIKMLRVARQTGQPAVAPTVANTLDHSYPISRSLLVYTLGEPQGPVKHYLDWILSDDGQKVVEETGYVPVPAAARVAP